MKELHLYSTVVLSFKVSCCPFVDGRVHNLILKLVKRQNHKKDKTVHLMSHHSI